MLGINTFKFLDSLTHNYLASPAAVLKYETNTVSAKRGVVEVGSLNAG